MNGLIKIWLPESIRLLQLLLEEMVSKPSWNWSPRIFAGAAHIKPLWWRFRKPNKNPIDFWKASLFYLLKIHVRAIKILTFFVKYVSKNQGFYMLAIVLRSQLANSQSKNKSSNVTQNTLIIDYSCRSNSTGPVKLLWLDLNFVFKTRVNNFT